MPVRLTDPDVAMRLEAVEGESWMKSVGLKQLSEYQCAFQAFLELLDGEPFPASESPWLEYQGRDLDTVFYGAEGYSRYRICGDGEMVLWGNSTRPAKVVRAREQGFNVYGDGPTS